MDGQVRLLVGKRQSKESARAVHACNDYLRLGPRRSLSALAIPQTRDNPTRPRTRLEILERWSDRFDWPARAKEYDTRMEAEMHARAQEIMQTGLASTQGRIDALMDLAKLLEAQILAQLAKQGYHMSKPGDGTLLDVDAVIEQARDARVNKALVKQYLGVRNDLVKETGRSVRESDTSRGRQTEKPPSQR